MLPSSRDQRSATSPYSAPGTSGAEAKASTRVDCAARLLRDGQSVTEAALAAGYANPSHFAKRFRLRHGQPPRAWLTGGE
ncbi:helix-turn-helix domain-containing protein [Azospirillum sp. RWY-5-1]|uniref:Helix-turn-helix domain-containing protein n=1 Tax=Azospirillum oleiclasticum TaxID=2735135 RepID=A0ABX2TCD9_9PROT|nr:helix-turn-helix domain-containing protein [Azospirillum oleiclasticum]NYZ20808.1 helix-turn-helix domain-containing protein [Azospirillum oleiclasticum]